MYAAVLNDALKPPRSRGPRLSREQKVCIGDALFFEGEPSAALYKVLDGVLINFKILPDGRRHVISFSYPGDVVGFGHGDRYHSDCTALTAARVRRTPTAALLEAARRDPMLSSRLLDCAAGQVAALEDHSVLLGRKTALEKTATFLISLANRTLSPDDDTGVIALPMTRLDIADYLGATIETISRNLSLLKRAGVIDMPQAATIRVRDRARLEAAADGEKVVA